MTLEQWAYFGEIVAAIAVVASLIYVARQMRQHTTMMRVNASNERLQRDYELSSTMESREFVEIWLKGNTDFDSLDEIDRTRLFFFERRAIMHWHNMFEARKQHLLSDADWHELKWLIQTFGEHQSVRRTWSKFKGGFDLPFQAFMEDQLSRGDEIKPEA